LIEIFEGKIKERIGEVGESKKQIFLNFQNVKKMVYFYKIRHYFFVVP
jgi:hypothetical protein